MSYQPDYSPAIRVATSALIQRTGMAPESYEAAQEIVMALVKSGEMVCVPDRMRNATGRKTATQLSHENAALRDWMGVLIDECSALNYQQYIDYAKQLLRRVYGTSSKRPVTPTPIIAAADRLANFAAQNTYGRPELARTVREYWRVRGPSA